VRYFTDFVYYYYYYYINGSAVCNRSGSESFMPTRSREGDNFILLLSAPSFCRLAVGALLLVLVAAAAAAAVVVVVLL
jgi:hypothetical protein